MNKSTEAARRLLVQCLGLRKGERVLIVCDDHTRRVAEALFQASLSLEARPHLLQAAATQLEAGEPSEIVASGLLQADVGLCATSKSITHTEAVRTAYLKGARIASMPGITEAMLIRTLGADYTEIERLSRGLSRILDEGKTVEVATERGTHIGFSIEGRRSIADAGSLMGAASIGNIPAGESFLAPVERTAEGVLMVDGSITSIGRVRKPVRIVVRRGSVVEIDGGKQAEELLTKMEKYEPEAKILGEFGIGANRAARISGVPLEDEKVLGTAHVAFGKNASFGGAVDCPIHLDCIFRRPSVDIDGVKIMHKGKPLL